MKPKLSRLGLSRTRRAVVATSVAIAAVFVCSLLANPLEATMTAPHQVEAFVSKGSASITFNHSQCVYGEDDSDTCTPSYSLDLADGEIFLIHITNTDTAKFTYSTVGVLVAKKDSGSGQAGRPPIDEITIPQVHDKRFGGYLVRIRAKNATTAKGTNLGNASLRISVTTREMKIGFGGGFTIAGLVDPPYAVRQTVTPSATSGGASTTSYTFIEQDGRRDQASRGMGSFVHVWHSAWDKVALSFGLGLSSNQSANYYFGPSIRLGDKAFLTGGALWGTVKAPPSGTDVGTAVPDANVLNNLGTRTARSWFFGVSYSFISNVQDALTKPFANPQTQPSTDVTQTPGNSFTLTCPDVTMSADTITLKATSSLQQSGTASWKSGKAPDATPETGVSFTSPAENRPSSSAGVFQQPVTVTAKGPHYVTLEANIGGKTQQALCKITR